MHPKEVKEYFDEQNFVKKTALQINKDLGGLSEYEINTEKIDKQSDTLNFFLTKLELALTDLVETNQLQQFIYLVDIPESEYLKSLTSGDLNALAFLVLRREAKKVYLKMRFSQA